MERRPISVGDSLTACVSAPPPAMNRLLLLLDARQGLHELDVRGELANLLDPIVSLVPIGTRGSKRVSTAGLKA
eukprot:scaffold40995_cov39-Tisochrysis_lutea.AAC.5